MQSLDGLRWLWGGSGSLEELLVSDNPIATNPSPSACIECLLYLGGVWSLRSLTLHSTSIARNALLQLIPGLLALDGIHVKEEEQNDNYMSPLRFMELVHRCSSSNQQILASASYPVCDHSKEMGAFERTIDELKRTADQKDAELESDIALLEEYIRNSAKVSKSEIAKLESRLVDGCCFQKAQENRINKLTEEVRTFTHVVAPFGIRRINAMKVS